MTHAIHPCPLCGRRLKGLRGLARHMDDVHPKLGTGVLGVIPTHVWNAHGDFDTVAAAEGVAPEAEASP